MDQKPVAPVILCAVVFSFFQIEFATGGSIPQIRSYKLGRAPVTSLFASVAIKEPTQNVRTSFKVSGPPSPDRKQLVVPPNPPKPVPVVEVKPQREVDPVILSPTDMPGDMLTFATETAVKALLSFTSVADIAEYMRLKFESRFPSVSGNWQANVGSSFASSIRKKTGTGFYARIRNVYVLLYASP